MNTKNQNKANFQSLYTCVPIYVHTCILPNKPKFQFLYTCIPVYLHTRILPNEPNFPRRACVELHYPVRPRGIEPDRVRPNEPNFNTTYLCNLCNRWFQFLRNEPNLKAGCRPPAAKLHLQETALHDILLTCNMNT